MDVGPYGLLSSLPAELDNCAVLYTKRSLNSESLHCISLSPVVRGLRQSQQLCFLELPELLPKGIEVASLENSATQHCVRHAVVRQTLVLLQ